MKQKSVSKLISNHNLQTSHVVSIDIVLFSGVNLQNGPQFWQPYVVNPNRIC